MCNAK